MGRARDSETAAKEPEKTAREETTRLRARIMRLERELSCSKALLQLRDREFDELMAMFTD